MATEVVHSAIFRQEKLLFCCRSVSNNLFFIKTHVHRPLIASRSASWMVTWKGIKRVDDAEAETSETTPESESVQLMPKPSKAELDPEEELLINSKRDVSRLPKRMKRWLLHSSETPGPSGFYEHNHARNMRMMYSYFGKASRINPNVSWPSHEELREMIEFEQDWEPSLQERLEKLRLEKEEELEERRLLEKSVEEGLSKMPTYMEKFKERLDKRDEDLESQETTRKALLEDARDYFGYSLDHRDPRFLEWQEEKAAEEQQKKKKMKKLLKQMKDASALDKLKESFEEEEKEKN